MKPQPTIELKEALYGCYYGQRVVKYKGKESYTYQLDNVYRLANDKTYLALKSTSTITEEHAAAVVEILMTIGLRSTAMRDPLSFLQPFREGKGTTGIVAPVVDYLRSKGYALPFMGYTVEELVKLKWVKLEGF